MKFFDPKKKEQNPSAYPPPPPAAVPPSPVEQPVPATPAPPAVPAPPAPLPRPPAETVTLASADTAPTVMIPIPAQPPASPAPAQPPAPAAAPAPVAMPEPPAAPVPQKPVLVTQRVVPQQTGQTLIGSTVMIKGDITANESVLVDGFIEGSMETTGDVHVGLQGKVYASVRADNIKISGKVVGNITATNKVELDPTAVLEGNIRSPRLSISESALFRGSIDMRPVVTKEAGDDTQKEKKPASSASVEPA